MKRSPKAMVVAGVMSGTSADGVDVALVRISPRRAQLPTVKLLGHREFPYPSKVRSVLLRFMEGQAMSAAAISQLNWTLGAFYAECVASTCTSLSQQIALIGVHGQTVYHQSTARPYLGRATRATWQLGEAAVLRERLGVPVVSDFRPADLAAGGQGAPLVPVLDHCLFRSPTASRLLLNLGGIANLSLIPALAKPDQVIAFDTGPANMVCDALMMSEFGKAFDRDGKIAAGGRVLDAVVTRILKQPYFRQSPPKSCGREQFGEAFAQRFALMCRQSGGNAADTLASATDLTVASVALAIDRFCSPRLSPGPIEVVASGGGTRNIFLMKTLAERLRIRGIPLLTTDDLGVTSQSKEAVAFALLAWLTWHGLPGNLPSATGATHPVILGKVSP